MILGHVTWLKLGSQEGKAMKCSKVGCDEKAVRGFKVHRGVSTLTSRGILPVGTTAWCEEHEDVLMKTVSGPGIFVAVSELD